MQHASVGPDWLSPRIPHWLNVLASMRGMPNLHCLEIGCFEGRTSTWLLENILTDDGARLTCIDRFELTPAFRESLMRQRLETPKDFDMEASFNAALRPFSQKTTKLKGDASVLLRGLPVNTYDLIILDASQKTPDILRHAVAAFDLLRVHGLLCLCKTTFEKPYENRLHEAKEGVDAFCRCFADDADVLHTDGDDVWLRKKETDSVPSQST